MEASLDKSIPNAYYTDENHFQHEVDSVFKGEWVFVCHKSQIANKGDYTSLDFCNIPIFLLNNGEEIKAFYNTCPHRGHTIVGEDGHCSKFLTCPYHAWSFSFDGDLVGAPGKKFFPPEEFQNIRLKELYIVDIKGLIFINTEKKDASQLIQAVETFASDLGVEFENYTFHKKYHYVVNCNWKILVDNYLECYHCKPCHPSFVDLMQVSTYQITTYSNYSNHRAQEGRADNSAYHFDQTDPSRSDKFNGWFLFPNLTFNIFPGQKGLLIFYMFPI